MYKIKGVVQHYSWGGTEFIPGLISAENKEQQPFAEYWMGAHPASPAQLLNGDATSLYAAIEAAPAAFLGEKVASAFGTLPYLLKILDVRQMLSIQVHPSIESAIKGYEEEDQKGVSLKAPNRNYKDKNHKPELMAALGDFWLLHGFKPEEKLLQIFERVPELSFLQSAFAEGGYQALYEKVMTMPQSGVDEVLAPLMNKLLPAYEKGELQKSSEDFWAARAVKTFCKNGHYDRGIFSIYFFNLLHLKTGEGIYQPAGLPHAYLEGQNVELMANSDNVLRAGLTDKHIDVPELMKHVRFEATVPDIIPASKDAVQVYGTPAAEFELTKLALHESTVLKAETATILFVYEGSVSIHAAEKMLRLERGEAGLILAGQTVNIKPEKEAAMLFAAATPVAKN